MLRVCTIFVLLLDTATFTNTTINNPEAIGREAILGITIIYLYILAVIDPYKGDSKK